MTLDFVAIDFETANNDRSSACAVGLAFVRRGIVTNSVRYLVRPPSRQFNLSWVHGLTWADVRHAPDFEQLWHRIRRELKSEILVAHNASFDRSVLSECLRYYNIRYKVNPFICSQQTSKEAFRFKHLDLEYICKRLNITLHHHDPESDAKAAAGIVIKAAQKLGLRNATPLLRLCGS